MLLKMFLFRKENSQANEYMTTGVHRFEFSSLDETFTIEIFDVDDHDYELYKSTTKVSEPQNWLK